jgi:hypothetical protein
VLMTHLCHKPGAGGDRDSAVQQPIWHPYGLGPCYSASIEFPGMGGADDPNRTLGNLPWRDFPGADVVSSGSLGPCLGKMCRMSL